MKRFAPLVNVNKVVGKRESFSGGQKERGQFCLSIKRTTIGSNLSPKLKGGGERFTLTAPPAKAEILNEFVFFFEKLPEQPILFYIFVLVAVLVQNSNVEGFRP